MSGSSTVSNLRARAPGVLATVAPSDDDPAHLKEFPESNEIKALLEGQPYQELTVEFDQLERVLWYFMAPAARPSATIGLMEDIRHLQSTVRGIFANYENTSEPPIKYMVLGSRMPGIFNLGGDLALFGQLIRDRDRNALHDYARLAIGIIYTNAVNLELPIITVSVVQGDALGGGFEAALSSNLVIAERSAKFGLPEVLFNLFPGMGAYSFLARRVDPVQAERMMLSGEIFAAEQLQQLGIIDLIAEDGAGEQMLYDHLTKNGRHFNAHQSIYRVRRRVNPISFEEMADIADIWVDAALRLDQDDVNRMERLAAAQCRRWQRAS